MPRDINLIGGFYEAKSLPFSAQDTVNWLPVPAQVQGSRSPIKLRGLPGLKALAAPAPPQGRIFTSTIYPVQVIEDFSVTGSLNAGVVVFPITEAVDSTAAISGGELRSILKLYDWPDEAIDSSATVDNGELRTILKAYDWPDEAIDSSATVDNGELRTILIIYNNWPDEAIDSTATIDGGALA